MASVKVIYRSQNLVHPTLKTTNTPNLMHNVLWLQGVLEKIKLKIQKLEKAIHAQSEVCKEPCKTKCPIPVVSGECSAL